MRVVKWTDSFAALLEYESDQCMYPVLWKFSFIKNTVKYVQKFVYIQKESI